MSPEQAREFLDSLDGEKGLPEILYGNRFDASIESLMDMPKNIKAHDKTGYQYGELPNIIEYLIERCRRAESRQIHDLKERVKKFVDAAMEAEGRFWRSSKAAYIDAERGLFRALCATEVNP